MPKAKNGSLTKIVVVWQKLDFWTKKRNFGPKKNGPTFSNSPCSGHDWKKLFKEKSAFAQIIRGEISFWAIFLGTTHFEAKNHFSAKRKNARFSVIPARTGSVVLLGHFFDGPDDSPEFR